MTKVLQFPKKRVVSESGDEWLAANHSNDKVLEARKKIGERKFRKVVKMTEVFRDLYRYNCGVILTKTQFLEMLNQNVIDESLSDQTFFDEGPGKKANISHR